MIHTQTQTEAILDYLMEGKSITQLQALKNFGCLRLSAIIFNLRKEGFHIITERVGHQGYARYTLA